MTNPDNPNIINFDLWKQAAGGRHQIGTLAGFRSEQVAGFLLECMAGFVGIRTPRPNALWVSNFTYVATWAGFVYIAFVIDTFARRIVGWRASRTVHAGFVLDALEQALCERRPLRGGLVHHSDLPPRTRKFRRQRVWFGGFGAALGGAQRFEGACGTLTPPVRQR